MKTRHKVFLALAGLVGAFALGRLTRECPGPSIIHETSKQEKSETWHEAVNATVNATKSVESAQSTHRVKKWYRKDGTLAREETTGTIASSQSREAVEASHSASATGESKSNQTTTKTTVTGSSKDWSLRLDLSQDARQALAGTFSPVGTVTLTRRLIGPIDAFGYVSVPVRDMESVSGGVGVSVTVRF